MDTDPSPDQGPSSVGDERNETSRNDTARTTAEFNHVVAAYNVTPNVVNNARAFAQVGSLHLSLPCFLTAMHSSDQIYNFSISTSESKRSGQL